MCDDRSRQIDEIEALTSIYNGQLRVEDEACRSYSIDIGETGRCVTLYVTLPAQYPSQAPPVYQISAPNRLLHKREISNLLEAVYLENIGEPVIYQWIEEIRDYLENKIHRENIDSGFNLTVQSTINSPNSACHKPVFTPDIIHGDIIEDRKSIFQGHVATVTSDQDVKRKAVTCCKLDNNGLCIFGMYYTGVTNIVLFSDERGFCYLADLQPLERCIVQCAGEGDAGNHKTVLAKMLENKKIASATHNISAYRFLPKGSNCQVEDCNDDGESQAGGRLLHLLQIMGVNNVLVVVTRWYGGIQLGPGRFRHINNAARQVIQKTRLSDCNKKKTV